MKIMKKIRLVSAMLIILLVFGSFAPVTIGASGTVSKAELTSQSEEFLRTVGATSKAYVSKDFLTTLKRSEMANIIANMIRVNHVMPTPSVEPAADVNLKNAQLAHDVFIVTAYDIMHNYSNGKFNPDGFVTYGDVKYAFASLLGYINYAKATGLGDAELSKLIAKTDIFENVKYVDDDYITLADFLIMFRNAIDEEMIYQTHFSGDSVAFDKTTDVTMLEEYFNVVVYEGMVTANKHTSIFEPTGLDADQVLVEGYLINTGNTNISDYIGSVVEVYVKEDEDGKKGTALIVDYASDAKTLVISAEDMMADNSSFSLTNITYADEKGKIKSAKVVSTANYFYNGRMCDLSEEDFNINNGSVTLVSNDGGSTYDVVKIETYENYIVEYIDGTDEEAILYAKSDKKEIDKNGKYVEKTLDLRENGEDGFRYIDIRRSNGRVVKPSQIKPGNVVSAYVSKDGGYIKAVLSTTIVEGEVTGIDESGSRSVFTIGGKDYQAFYFGTDWSYAGLTYADMYPLFGAEGEFYIDANGYVAYIENRSVTTKYGLLTGIIRASSMSADVTLQIVDENGAVVEIDVPEKGVKINNYDGRASYTKPGELYELLNGKDQLVQYSLSNDGMLRKLNLAQNVEETPNNVFESYNESVFTLDYTIASAEYNTTTSKFGSASSTVASPGSGTKIFVVEQNAITDGDISSDGVTVVSKSKLRHAMKLSDIKFYDMDDTYTPAVMLAIEPPMSTSDASADQKLYIFDEATRKLNAEGEEEISVSLWDRGTLKKFTLAEDGVLEAAKKGDAVAVYRNFDNEITLITNVKATIDNGGLKGTVIYRGGGSDEFSCYGYVGKAYMMAASAEKMAYVYDTKNVYDKSDIKTLWLTSPTVYEVTEGDRDTVIRTTSLTSLPQTLDPDENSIVYYFANQGRVYDAVIYR